MGVTAASTTPRVLVAGVGNLFLGDDGFGSEVARVILGGPGGPEPPRGPGEAEPPASVHVVDVGIRGIHLAYELMDGYDALILVDATQRGGRPGDLYVIRPEPRTDDDRPAESVLHDPHGMEPGSVLDLADTLGAAVGVIRVVGCEPHDIGERIGLSAPVAAAVPAAVALVHEVVGDVVAELAAVGTAGRGRGAHA